MTDRGPGIPADVQDRVFDWFETHSLGSHHRGTGLGLSIVRSFVELHGGTVSLESAVGRGTTVTCVFPSSIAHGARRRDTQIRSWHSIIPPLKGEGLPRDSIRGSGEQSEPGRVSSDSPRGGRVTPPDHGAAMP